MNLKVCGLKKSFGDRLIFEDVSFEISEGRIIGIYGDSGIGKSTLAKVLCGIFPPDEGEVYLDGELLCAKDRPYDRRRGLQIQMVYQQPYASLDPNQRLRNGFRELIRYHRWAPDRKAADVLTDDLMHEVGIDPKLLEHWPHQVSGGEAQRIAIARCLLFRPGLLILDEATSMLDVSTQANVVALVKRKMAENHGSVMFISHDLELLRAVCDDILVFQDHKLLCKRKDL